MNELVWVDRDGELETFPLPPGNYYGPALSPDRTRIAFTGGAVGETDIWVYDIRNRTPLRLSTGAIHNVAIWSPDGSRIAFNRIGEGEAREDSAIYTMAGRWQ